MVIISIKFHEDSTAAFTMSCQEVEEVEIVASL